MFMVDFDNTYARLPAEFHAPAVPDAAPRPTLLGWNQDLARQLGLDTLAKSEAQYEAELAALFSGSKPVPGSEPIAMAYAGHQFGGFNPQLGDGRATLLGEVISPSGQRFDIQLKGSGRTAFSRGGDGKSWLGPVVREYILSEAMHRLGVPTTRALAAVATGETVFREAPRPGGVFTRVAASHLRIGTFEYFAARGQPDALRTLADYAIDRHYPEARQASAPYVEFFRQVAERQARLIAHWMSIGFIHGVMNTDNTAISGETIDYGPAAYLDEFRFDKVFSSIDEHGRYAYQNQPRIAQWNLMRLAETLLALEADKSALEEVLKEFPEHYTEQYLALMRPKLGLTTAAADDLQLLNQWLQLLQERELDYTLSFRELATRVDATDDSRFGDFEAAWRQRLAAEQKPPAEIAASMNAVNPLFIPRNHQIERAIADAVNGDLELFHALNTALSRPFDEQPEYAHLAVAPEPAERVTQTFCGT